MSQQRSLIDHDFVAAVAQEISAGDPHETIAGELDGGTYYDLARTVLEAAHRIWVESPVSRRDP